MEIDVVVKQHATKHILVRLNELKKFNRLKRHPILSEASKTEWRKPFEFLVFPLPITPCARLGRGSTEMIG